MMPSPASNPVSSAHGSPPAGPASVVGSAPPGAFASELARSEQGRKPSAAASPAQPAQRSAGPASPPKPQAATAPAGSTAAASASASRAHARSTTDKTGPQVRANDLQREADRTDAEPGTADGLDALLSRLADSATLPDQTTLARAEDRPAPPAWPGSAGPVSDNAEVLTTAHPVALPAQTTADLAGTDPDQADTAPTADGTSLGVSWGAAARMPTSAASAQGQDSASAASGLFQIDSTDALQAAAAATHDGMGGPGSDKPAPTGSSMQPALASVSALATPGSASISPGTGAAATSLPEARLPAAPGHADFAPQLGAQISLFVREGVQQARLQLNPAEMGPITVQIRLEGGAAQVHLAAENALTRQALEQAMPTLAGSLREGGLTLTGGGVFEQPGQADPSGQGTAGGQAQGRPGTGRPEPFDTEPGSPLASTRSRGVVDLVA